MFGFGEAMVRASDQMDLFGRTQMIEDPKGLFYRYKFIFLSVDDQTVGNPRQKRKQAMLWQIFKKGFGWEWPLLAPLLRLKVIHMKRGGPDNHSLDLFIFRSPEQGEKASEA